ncbi:MAG: translation initiation factor IF-2, partial [Fidelibacterota bacterium]
EQEFRKVKLKTLDEISRQIKEGIVKELLLIVKADVDGSIEALSDALMKLGTDEVTVNVIHKGVGSISENDVLLATASNAIIIGFHVGTSSKAKEIAKKENIDIRIYDVIYSAVDDVKLALEGLLTPEQIVEVIGEVEIKEVFRVPKVGAVAGCFVTSGKIRIEDPVRLKRDGEIMYEGEVISLKRFKDDVKEILEGLECGIVLKDFEDYKIGDIIEVLEISTVRKKL